MTGQGKGLHFDRKSHVDSSSMQALRSTFATLGDKIGAEMMPAEAWHVERFSTLSLFKT